MEIKWYETGLIKIYDIIHEKRYGPVLRAKFHPHRCNDKGVGPQN